MFRNDAPEMLRHETKASLEYKYWFNRTVWMIPFRSWECLPRAVYSSLYPGQGFHGNDSSPLPRLSRRHLLVASFLEQSVQTSGPHCLGLGVIHRWTYLSPNLDCWFWKAEARPLIFVFLYPLLHLTTLRFTMLVEGSTWINQNILPFLERAMHCHAFAHASSFPGKPLTAFLCQLRSHLLKAVEAELFPPSLTVDPGPASQFLTLHSTLKKSASPSCLLIMGS